MVDAPALRGLNKVAFQKEIQFIYYNCNALNGLSDRTHVCPLMTQSGHSTSYDKTRMTQLLATASIRWSSLPSVALRPLDVLAGHASEDFERGTIKSRL